MDACPAPQECTHTSQFHQHKVGQLNLNPPKHGGAPTHTTHPFPSLRAPAQLTNTRCGTITPLSLTQDANNMGGVYVGARHQCPYGAHTHIEWRMSHNRNKVNKNNKETKNEKITKQTNNRVTNKGEYTKEGGREGEQ